MLVKFKGPSKGGYGTVLEAHRRRYWAPGRYGHGQSELRWDFTVHAFGHRDTKLVWSMENCTPWDDEAVLLFTMIKLGCDISHLIKVT